MTNREGRIDPPLRLCLLDSIAQWGGGERWCLLSAEELTRRGHQVTIACARGSALEERAREAGLSTWTARVGRLGWQPGSSRRLARHLREQRIETVIANVGRDLRLGAPACRRAGAALVQRRGLLRAIKPGYLNRRLYQRHVRAIIVNSEAIRERMVAGVDFVEPERFTTIPNGVDTSHLPAGDGPALRARLDLPADAPLAAVVARLAPMKGHAHLLEAWPAVREALPGAVLLVVGEGELRAELTAQAARLELGDSLRFLGFQRDIGAVLAAIDLLVLPSVRDEGCNNTLLEAMWHARPAVVTRCGGLAEIVAEGRTGRIVPPGDSAALAQALCDLLADSAARERMGRAARQVIVERYSLAAVTALLEDLLVEVRPRASASR